MSHRYYAWFLEQPFGVKDFITQKSTKGGLRCKRLKEPHEKKIAQNSEFLHGVGAGPEQVEIGIQYGQDPFLSSLLCVFYLLME